MSQCGWFLSAPDGMMYKPCHIMPKKNVLGIVLYGRFILKANLQQSANKVNG